MRMILTHKIRLRPTRKQEQLLRCAVGVSRFAYNWALAEWQMQYKHGLKPNEAQLRKQLNAAKAQAFPWMYDVPKSVVQQAIKNLGTAFRNFFEKRTKYPRFKRRGVHDSARFDNGPNTFQCVGKAIKLPVVGSIKMFEVLRFEGRPLSATISCVAGKWFASIPVEVEVNPIVSENQAAVGIDLGLTSFCTLSTGLKITAPKPLSKLLTILQRRGRRVSRKVKGSQNRRKAVLKLAQLHHRIANIRADFLHQTTSCLVNQFRHIGIEDLSVKNMMQNRCLSRAIADVSWFEFRRQLDYKCKLAGCSLIVHSKWFASSKVCSACGVVEKSMPLTVRTWTCSHCTAIHDRDINAAINLKPTVSSTGSNACGDESAGSSLFDCRETVV